MGDEKRQRSVYMPDDLWSQIRKASIDQGLTTSVLIERILEEAFNPKAKAQRVTPVTTVTGPVTDDPFLAAPKAAPKPGRH